MSGKEGDSCDVRNGFDNGDCAPGLTCKKPDPNKGVCTTKSATYIKPLSTGQIVGIAVGFFVALSLIIALLVLLLRKNEKVRPVLQ